VEEGKKKVRNTFGQSNFLFTILSWIVWLSVAVSKHRNEDTKSSTPAETPAEATYNMLKRKVFTCAVTYNPK
jgi:hypothetical protein